MNEKTEAHKRCMKIYYDWFQDQRGFKPRIDAADGSGMKQLVAYLHKLSPTEDGVVNAFQYILDHWGELDAFHQKQIRIRQINGNLVNIIDFFRNEHRKNTTGVSKDYIEGLINDMQ